MTGGWVCRECAERLGVPFFGMSSPYGHCKAGSHDVAVTIRWIADLAESEPFSENPARVAAAIVAATGGKVDEQRVEELARACDEVVPLAKKKKQAVDDTQGSLF